jgi:intraflagellar transport protein 122
MDNHKEFLKLAEIYQAYSLVNTYIEETSYTKTSAFSDEVIQEAIFNASRFLVNNLGSRVPNGINIVYVFYAMATLGYKFEAFKTAREGFEKLLSLKVPKAWQERVDIDHLKIRAKPYNDKEGLAWTCNRCICVNPLINPKGDFCVQCGAPGIRNFGSFDCLPLVEFVPEPNIPPVRVKELLKMDPPSAESDGGAGQPRQRRN